MTVEIKMHVREVRKAKKLTIVMIHVNSSSSLVSIAAARRHITYSVGCCFPVSISEMCAILTPDNADKFMN